MNKIIKKHSFYSCIEFSNEDLHGNEVNYSVLLKNDGELEWLGILGYLATLMDLCSLIKTQNKHFYKG